MASADAPSARVLDLTELRRYADEPASTFRQDRHQAVLRGPRTYLALSGGGADGAYGAGVLNGWTEAGTRPSFSIVSGVSTGALIAPFAFLGPDHDATLRHLYTRASPRACSTRRAVQRDLRGGLFGNTGCATGGQLHRCRLRRGGRRRIRQGAAAADRHDQSGLAAHRDMGHGHDRLAAHARSLNLFRDVVAASASLPVVFPPMLVTAEANGRRFQEMHVDGGVTAPVLTLPEAFLLRDAKLAKGRRSAALHPDQQQGRAGVSARSPTARSRSRRDPSSTIVKTQTRSILYSTYDFARRNKFGFNLTYIEGRIAAAASLGIRYRLYARACFSTAMTGHEAVKPGRNLHHLTI